MYVLRNAVTIQGHAFWIFCGLVQVALAATQRENLVQNTEHLLDPRVHANGYIGNGGHISTHKGRMSKGLKPLVSCGTDSLVIQFLSYRHSSVYLRNGEEFWHLCTGTLALSAKNLTQQCHHVVLRQWPFLILRLSYRGCYVHQRVQGQKQYNAVDVQYWDRSLRRRRWVNATCHTDVASMVNPINTETIKVMCGKSGMMIKLPPGPLESIMVSEARAWVPVHSASERCGYDLSSHHNYNSLFVKFSGCHLKMKKNLYSLRLRFLDDGRNRSATMFCKSQISLLKRKSIFSGPGMSYVPNRVVPRVPSPRRRRELTYDVFPSLEEPIPTIGFVPITSPKVTGTTENIYWGFNVMPKRPCVPAPPQSDAWFSGISCDWLLDPEGSGWGAN